MGFLQIAKLGKKETSSSATELLQNSHPSRPESSSKPPSDIPEKNIDTPVSTAPIPKIPDVSGEPTDQDASDVTTEPSDQQDSSASEDSQKDKPVVDKDIVEINLQKTPEVDYVKDSGEQIFDEPETVDSVKTQEDNTNVDSVKSVEVDPCGVVSGETMQDSAKIVDDNPDIGFTNKNVHDDISDVDSIEAIQQKPDVDSAKALASDDDNEFIAESQPFTVTNPETFSRCQGEKIMTPIKTPPLPSSSDSSEEARIMTTTKKPALVGGGTEEAKILTPVKRALTLSSGSEDAKIITAVKRAPILTSGSDNAKIITPTKRAPLLLSCSSMESKIMSPRSKPPLQLTVQAGKWCDKFNQHRAPITF